MERPGIITVISWVFIITAILGFLSIAVTVFLPQYESSIWPMGSPGLQGIIWILIMSAVISFSGILMLKGRNLGRLLYFWFAPVSLVLSFIVFGWRDAYVLTAIFYAVLVVILTGRKVKKFFKPVLKK